MLIKSVRGFTPKYGIDCFFAENSTIIGEVIMGDNCSVWYQAVIRGDVNSIEIGNCVNIQDGAVIHGTYEQSGTKIGNHVSVGHNAIIRYTPLFNQTFQMKLFANFCQLGVLFVTDTFSTQQQPLND